MSDWQLVIPMSGLGSRFVAAGYTVPKPLIEVQGRPMIDWVLRMFPGATAPLFICRREHIDHTPMRDVLLALRPDAQIAVIEGAKRGPIDALLKIEPRIADDRPVIVSYCDYYMQWDYAAFQREAAAQACAGAVPCYTGFHPHLLPMKNLYAGCRVDDRDRLLEIKEKYSFSADKRMGRHSPGAYYFASGELLKHYARALLQSGATVNGEYYVSMIYPYLIEAGLTIWAPANVTRFCQWGTPEDLDDYLYWTNKIRRFAP